MGTNPIEWKASSEIVYLDMNIVISLRKGENPSLLPVIQKLRNEGYIFPYSPAHIEEIAMIARRTEDETEADIRVNENLDHLARLTEHIELIRGERESDPTEFRRECPSDCIKGVGPRFFALRPERRGRKVQWERLPSLDFWILTSFSLRALQD